MDSKTIICIAIGAFLVLMNIISFSMMALDKKRAQKVHSQTSAYSTEKTCEQKQPLLRDSCLRMAVGLVLLSPFLVKCHHGE